MGMGPPMGVESTMAAYCLIVNRTLKVFKEEGEQEKMKEEKARGKLSSDTCGYYDFPGHNK